MSDAFASIELSPSTDDRTKSLNGKALFRVAAAAYSLGQYSKNETVLGDLLSIDPGDTQAAILRQKCQLRVKEQNTRQYNFVKIRNRLGSSHIAEAASYTAKTRLGPRPGSVLKTSVFAAKDVKAGDLVLCEKAFAITTQIDKPADFFSHDIHEDGSGYLACSGLYAFAAGKVAVDKVSRNKVSREDCGARLRRLPEV